MFKGKCEGHTGVKRLKLPGVTFETECPQCKDSLVKDLGGNDYLSYPDAGKPFEYTVYCMKCDYEQVYCVQLDISIRVVPDKTDALLKALTND